MLGTYLGLGLVRGVASLISTMLLRVQSSLAGTHGRRYNYGRILDRVGYFLNRRLRFGVRGHRGASFTNPWLLRRLLIILKYFRRAIFEVRAIQGSFLGHRFAFISTDLLRDLLH